MGGGSQLPIGRVLSLRAKEIDAEAFRGALGARASGGDFGIGLAGHDGMVSSQSEYECRAYKCINGGFAL